MPSSYLAFAHELADLSGDILRRYFRAPLRAEIKSDRTPVTMADREAEAAMRRLIAARHPKHGILGEEYGEERADAEYVWALDPIDGTRNFLIGAPIFGTLIALLEGGKPLLGVMDQPITGERWVGACGEKTTLNGVPVSTRHCARLEEAVIATTSPYLFSDAKRKMFEKLRERAAACALGGDCYAYAMLASGHLDLVIESGLKAHDIMALIPIIEGAGGVVTDWRGEPVAPGGALDILACGDRTLHQSVLQMIT